MTIGGSPDSHENVSFLIGHTHTCQWIPVNPSSPSLSLFPLRVSFVSRSFLLLFGGSRLVLYFRFILVFRPPLVYWPRTRLDSIHTLLDQLSTSSPQPCVAVLRHLRCANLSEPCCLFHPFVHSECCANWFAGPPVRQAYIAAPAPPTVLFLASLASPFTTSSAYRAA